MLWDVDKKREITQMPHKQNYDMWISRLSNQEIQSIKAEILSRIKGDKVATTGWIPGSDWTNTPFQPIYEKACLFSKEAAGMCFGLIVWEIMMEHEKCWSFGRYKLKDVPIRSMTYFRVDPDNRYCRG